MAYPDMQRLADNVLANIRRDDIRFKVNQGNFSFHVYLLPKKDDFVGHLGSCFIGFDKAFDTVYYVGKLIDLVRENDNKATLRASDDAAAEYDEILQAQDLMK